MLAQIFGIQTVDDGGGSQTPDERRRLKAARGKFEVFSKDLC